ncbi:hypothetical protein TrLO_g13736 [Triparma laevis f. longispina]|uniref:Uncharacterized protein n=1 Tax=Triparma laevis f. longispina TaxID=1714387 RepID=A0A9W7KYR7_9STRA|nr:hypothetical protein TrLO_g13736 [Triparma laevis f. longispina]
MKNWIKNGWKQWEEEKPEWFTDEFRASVPEDMIPKKNARDEETVTEVREEKKDVVVCVEKAQGSHRKSLLDTLKNRKENNKVAPDGVKKEQIIDVLEFKREIERRGSINL